MTLTELCNAVVDAATVRRGRVDVDRVRDDFAHLEASLKDAAAELFTKWGGATVLAEAGVPLDLTGSAALAGGVADDARSALALAQGPGVGLLDRRRFPVSPFVQKAEALARQIDRQLKQAWQAHYAATVPALSTEAVDPLRLLARGSPSRQEAMDTLRDRLGRLGQWRERLPKGRAEMDTFTRLVGEARAAEAVLIGGGGGPMARFVAALAKGPVPLSDLTPEVRAALDEAGLTPSLSVSVRQAWPVAKGGGR